MSSDIFIVYMYKIKGNSPVVRELNGSPCAVVEVHPDTGIIGGIAGFREDIADGIIEITVRVGCIARVEFPIGVEIEVCAGVGG